MNCHLSDAHKLIRDTARRSDKVAPRAAELDETGEYPHDIFQMFAEAGLLGLTVPESYGGSGADGPAAWSTWTFTDDDGDAWSGVFLALDLAGEEDTRFLYVRVQRPGQ